jgi:hypothetical protein
MTHENACLIPIYLLETSWCQSKENSVFGTPAFTKTLTMTSRLQLHLSAKDLKNLSGLMGKSDPFAVVTLRGDAPNNNPSIIGQTDV